MIKPLAWQLAHREIEVGFFFTPLSGKWGSSDVTVAPPSSRLGRIVRSRIELVAAHPLEHRLQ